MSALSDRLNRALAGRYAIQQELGTGGMATVFLADDLKHRRRVAIKVLHPELAAALGGQRFLREIELAAGLNHPHILPLHDSGSAADLFYYAMPFAEGESLRQRLAREKQLPLADALRIAREVANALDYAHRQNVVHRDIKPENILLQDGHAVVADFGIARALAAAGERLTATGVVIGTPAYMSPEQATGDGQLDPRSDIYSLGCVLYEMLAGQAPFTAATAESMAHQHLSVAPRPVRELRPTVPEAVGRVIARTLAKAAADRYVSAAELAAALVPLESVGVLGARVSAAEAATVDMAPPRRRRWRLAVLGGAALAVAVIALIKWSPWRRDPLPAHTVATRSAIAVLPFQNLSADAAHAYFAGGLHDELLTQLAKVEALQAISRTSVMGYQGTSKPLRQIADELKVGSVMQGSVQVVGGRLRVNVQLIDAATDRHLWAERYDRTLDDAFAIQSEVAQEIVRAVGAALTAVEEARLAAAPTTNAEAYRLYLQGQEYRNRPGILRNDRESAQKLFEQAVALDPQFALAHAELSQIHGQMHWLYETSAVRAARQREEAEVALKLAPHLPRAHFAMGLAHYQGRRDFRRALEEFTIAREGLPNDAEVWFWLGATHRRLGNWDQVLAAFDKATQLDPRSADVFNNLGGPTYLVLRRYPDAVREFDRTLTLAPDLHRAAIEKALTFVIWRGQLDSLRAALERLPQDATLGQIGSVDAYRAELLLLERNADGLLAMPAVARNDVFSAEFFMRPAALYAGWAYQLRGDVTAGRAAFDSAGVRLEARLREFPDDWRAHVSRGLALAGLGRREEALREARWLQQSAIYRKDAFGGPILAQDLAKILAQAGQSEPALDEIERLLKGPSRLSVHTLRLDPRWDSIREHPRFKALLKKYSSRSIDH